MNDYKIVDYMQIPLDINPNESTRTCFIVYSSWESHINITLDAIESVLEASGKFSIKRLAVHGISGYSQYSQLLEFLNACSLAIIVLDGFRPNVLFEYGVLVGLNKPCIVLLEQNAILNVSSFAKCNSKKSTNVDIDMDKDFSDVKDQMYIRYKYNDPKKLRELLSGELVKVEPYVEQAYMKLMFPEIKLIEQEASDSLAVFSELCNISEFTRDDEIRFRVCVNDIEKISNKYSVKLTLQYYYQKLQILIDLRELDEAIALIDNLINDNDNDTRLLLMKSYIFNLKGNHELSIDSINLAIRLDNKDETLWHHKALSLERLGRKDEAELCYKKGIEFNDGCSSIYYHYGILLLDNKQFNDALALFNKALKLRPSESKYLVCKAIALIKLGKIGLAKKAIEDAICFDENNADAWFQFGKITDNNLESIKYFEKCLSIETNHSGALCSKGANLSNIGQLEAACVEIQQGINKCGKYDGKGCETAHGNLGRTKYKLYKTGESEFANYGLEAIIHFEAALILSDDDDEREEYLNNIGYIYLSTNNFEKAHEYLTKAAAIELPDNKRKSIIYYNLALTNLMSNDLINSGNNINTAINLASRLKLEERKCYCLLAPNLIDSNIELHELNNEPDIYKCALVAKEFVEQITP